MASAERVSTRSWSEEIGALDNVEIKGKRVETLTRHTSSRGCVIVVPQLTETSPRVTLRLDHFTSGFAFGVRSEGRCYCRFFVGLDSISKTTAETIGSFHCSPPQSTEKVFNEKIEQMSELSVSFDRANNAVTFEYNGKKHSEEWKLGTEDSKVNACLWTFRPFVAVSLMTDASTHKSAIGSAAMAEPKTVPAYYCAKCTAFNRRGTVRCHVCGAAPVESSGERITKAPVTASSSGLHATGKRSIPKWQTEDWRCVECTIFNRKGTRLCHMCGALPPI